MDKKKLTRIIQDVIRSMNLTDKDLEKGREFAVGFLVGDVNLQEGIINFLKKPCDIKHGKKTLKIEHFIKFKRNFVRITCEKDG